MSAVYALLALALLCCVVFHVSAAQAFSEPQWRKQRLWSAAIALVELASAIALFWTAAGVGR